MERFTYQQWTAAGRPDAEWDAYRDQYNAWKRQQTIADLQSQWRAGRAMSGNLVLQWIEAKGVKVRPFLRMVLGHHETELTPTTVTGRGLTKREVSAIERLLAEANV